VKRYSSKNILESIANKSKYGNGWFLDMAKAVKFIEKLEVEE